MQARRDKGLCYNCDETYIFGHKCKARQFYIITTEEEREEEWHDAIFANEVMEEEGNHISPTISLHAPSGSSTQQTLKLLGTVGKKKFTFLVDRGSTHNFLDEETLSRLGCTIQATKEVGVTVAVGSQMKSVGSPKFQWSMQGEIYETDMRILKLGGCDEVLGIQFTGAKFNHF